MPLHFSLQRPHIQEAQNGVAGTPGHQLAKISGNVLDESVSPALLKKKKRMFSERHVTFDKWLPTISGHVRRAILKAVLSLTRGSQTGVRSLAGRPVRSSSSSSVDAQPGSAQHDRAGGGRSPKPRRKTGRAVKAAAAADASSPRGLESFGKKQ